MNIGRAIFFKWRLALGVLYYWPQDCREILQDSDLVNCDLWSRKLANQETTHAKNECTGDENVKRDVL